MASPRRDGQSTKLMSSTCWLVQAQAIAHDGGESFEPEFRHLPERVEEVAPVDNQNRRGEERLTSAVLTLPSRSAISPEKGSPARSDCRAISRLSSDGTLIFTAPSRRCGGAWPPGSPLAKIRLPALHSTRRACSLNCASNGQGEAPRKTGMRGKDRPLRWRSRGWLRRRFIFRAPRPGQRLWPHSCPGANRDGARRARTRIAYEERSEPGQVVEVPDQVDPGRGDGGRGDDSVEPEHGPSPIEDGAPGRTSAPASGRSQPRGGWMSRRLSRKATSTTRRAPAIAAGAWARWIVSSPKSPMSQGSDRIVRRRPGPTGAAPAETRIGARCRRS